MHIGLNEFDPNLHNTCVVGYQELRLDHTQARIHIERHALPLTEFIRGAFEHFDIVLLGDRHFGDRATDLQREAIIRCLEALSGLSVPPLFCVESDNALDERLQIELSSIKPSRLNLRSLLTHPSESFVELVARACELGIQVYPFDYLSELRAHLTRAAKTRVRYYSEIPRPIRVNREQRMAENLKNKLTEGRKLFVLVGDFHVVKKPPIEDQNTLRLILEDSGGRVCSIRFVAPFETFTRVLGDRPSRPTPSELGFVGSDLIVFPDHEYFSGGERLAEYVAILGNMDSK